MADKGDFYRPKRVMGNFLGKSRRNFRITNRCWELMHDLSCELGVNHGEIIELAVREMYARYYGTVPPIRYWDGTAAKTKKSRIDS